MFCFFGHKACGILYPDQSHIPCTGRQSLNHWTTTEVPGEFDTNWSDQRELQKDDFFKKILFQTIFPYMLLQNNEYISLCYTVGPCCLSVLHIVVYMLLLGASQVALVLENTPSNAGATRDMGSTPQSGRSPGGGLGHPLQYSCLESPHGQRSLVDYSPMELQKVRPTEGTEHLHMHTSLLNKVVLKNFCTWEKPLKDHLVLWHLFTGVKTKLNKYLYI